MRQSNQHRIEKITTDGEGSLVSASTFGPNEHDFEADDAHHVGQANKSNQELPLMHTEISELVDEDDIEVDEMDGKMSAASAPECDS